MVSPLRENVYNYELIESLHKLADPSSPHPILLIPEGPLSQLKEGTPVSNTSVANLMYLNCIQLPPSYFDASDARACSGVKKKCSVSVFNAHPYFIQFNDPENRGTLEKVLYYLCKTVSVLLSPVLGRVIHHVFIIYQLAKQYFTLKFNERSIISFITKDRTIPSWRQGEYIASASALNHSKRSLLYLIIERVVNLVLGILSICAFVITTMLCFKAGIPVFDLIAAFAPLAIILFMNSELSSSASSLLICGIIYAIPGVILYSFFTSSLCHPAWFILVPGMVNCILGMIYFICCPIIHACINRAITSIDRALLSLNISEQIRGSEAPNTSLSRLAAQNCLDPYNSLLDRQTFSEEADFEPEVHHRRRTSPPPPTLPSPPPSYENSEPPPSYEEAIRGRYRYS